MPRWLELTATAGLLAAAVPAAAQMPDGWTSEPAALADIVAGGQGCVGTTIVPAQADRWAGWTSLTEQQRDELDVNIEEGTQGDVLSRNNVLAVYASGTDGGCVVLARADADFEPAVFKERLGAAVGVTLPEAAEGEPMQLHLPNGETMVVVLQPQGKETTITLALANGARTNDNLGN